MTILAIMCHPSQPFWHRVYVRGPNPSGQQIKTKHSVLCCFGFMTWTHQYSSPCHISSDTQLVRHVDAEFRRWDEVFPGALCDHHAGLLVEHGGNFWRRLGDGQILSRLRVLAALEVVGHVTVLSQEGEELQQEVAEVLTDAEPPYRKRRTEWNLTVQQQ